MGSEAYDPLFVTTRPKGIAIYRVFATSIFLAICAVWIYRATQMPRKEEGGWTIRWGWAAMFVAEIWFTLYWILTQALRWNPVYRSTFKHRLSSRYENHMPRVDVFVCTADPVLELPIMVINTVLSVMAYDYPSEKLSVYLSDDGGSQLTFYALLEASKFSKHWLPYCRKYNVEPRCPAAYFKSVPKPLNATHASSLASIKKLYEEMETRIERSTELGRIFEETQPKHKGFSRWDSYSSRNDHDTILEILIDGRRPEDKDVEGWPLPTLVYLSREKRPQHTHNYKAGAMNALIRVSSKISNGEIILNVDCDMYSNNSQSIRHALCCFMDEKHGQEIAFVQSPQMFSNITKNDLYGNSFRVTMQVEFSGLDGFGGPIYIGTGCFHRRDALCGMNFSKDCLVKWKSENQMKIEASTQELEEEAKCLASCTYELKSQWGKEVGLKYGFIVEDAITGMTIHCRGWKSVLLNPTRPSFLGLAPTTLPQFLMQQERWGEGLLQLVLSKYCPLWYGHKKISFGHQLCYCHFGLWAANCLATLCYTAVPSLYLLKSIPLFPEISSPWFLPFAYIIISKCWGTFRGWWNEQRVWLYKRNSSYLFAFLTIVLKLLGLSDQAFVVTAKAADKDVSERYENEIMEFGHSSPMITLLATLALLNLLCFATVLSKAAMDDGIMVIAETLGLQIFLCAVLVLINFPLYEAMFFRKDKGKMPMDVTMKSVVYAFVGCIGFSLLLKG